MSRLLEIAIRPMNVYFLGIAGAGVSALASVLVSQGYQVSGSDDGVFPPVSTYLTRMGIPYHVGFDPALMPSNLAQFKPYLEDIAVFIPTRFFSLEVALLLGDDPCRHLVRVLQCLFQEKARLVKIAPIPVAGAQVHIANRGIVWLFLPLAEPQHSPDMALLPRNAVSTLMGKEQKSRVGGVVTGRLQPTFQPGGGLRTQVTTDQRMAEIPGQLERIFRRVNQ